MPADRRGAPLFELARMAGLHGADASEGACRSWHRGRIAAIPYKFLIYGKGGHFLAHRDTEKLDAMFGSLVIALPSAHEGGCLTIRHDGREVRIDFSQTRDAFQYAAFFADCEHAVEPVVSGFRCCLVYNLRLEKGTPRALNLPEDQQARTLRGPLENLMRSREGLLTAVLLEHGYTEANLRIANLKGHDHSRARALLAAADKAGLVAHLALVTLHQSGMHDGLLVSAGRHCALGQGGP